MWKILGHTNYECSEGPEEDFGLYDNESTAITKFIKLANDKDALDFEGLDEELDEWMSDPNWENDIYYGGSYCGNVVLYKVVSDTIRRELLVAWRDRDPKTRAITLQSIEAGEDLSIDEKRLLSERYGLTFG